MRGRVSALTLFALILLVGGVMVDQLWYKRHESRLAALTVRKAALEAESQAAHAAENEVIELLRYVQEKEEPGVDWLEQYRGQDALALLERLRTAAGLDRKDLILRDRAPHGQFLRTRYFMLLEGTYGQQMQFLQAMEQSLPLVMIDSFVLESLPGSRTLVLKLNASVFMLPGGGA